MTAICKTIDIHGGLSRLLDYGANELKTSLTNFDLQNVLDYAKNPLKTVLELDDGDKSMLVTGVLCTPETAELEFSFAREKYEQRNGREFTTSATIKDRESGNTKTVRKQPLTAVHLIQSFAEDDLDPLVVHQIGIDLCERMGWQAVVDTHMNTGHYHNHIIINAYRPDGGGKVCMNRDARIQIRQMSDDIQRESGLEVAFLDPELQQQKKNRTLNYREWNMKRKNLSWKDQIRSDMLAARHVSQTREDFVAVMLAYGYSIERQTDDSILWWNKTHTKKIWDHTLGDEYRLDHMMENEDCGNAFLTEQEMQDVRKHTRFISVARYSWDGRRRSDLELLIRKAISVVQHVSAFYHEAAGTYHYHADQKLAFMNEALDTISAFGIESEDDLKQKLNETGASLNHIKSEIRSCEASQNYYDELSAVVSEYESAKADFDSVKFWHNTHDDLLPNACPPSLVQINRAALAPATPNQRRDLYLAMRKRPDYRLLEPQKGYANISSPDAEAILRFFRGKGDPPDILVPITDPSLLPRETPPGKPNPPPFDQINKAQDKAFLDSIKSETPGKQRILIQLRNRHNALLSLGYQPEYINKIKQEIRSFYASLDDLKRERLEYSSNYKALIRLRQMTHNAESEPYLYGQALTKDQRIPEKDYRPDPGRMPEKDHHPDPGRMPDKNHYPDSGRMPDKAPPPIRPQLDTAKVISPDDEIPL